MLKFYVQRAQYEAAARYINANNAVCKSETQAKETIDRLIQYVIKENKKYPVMTAQSFGVLVYRVQDSEHVQLFVQPDLYDSMHGHNPTPFTDGYAMEITPTN